MIGIYGAHGFIGQHLVARLAMRGRRVRAVSRHFAPEFLDRYRGMVEFVEADFNDPLAMASTLHDCEIVVQLISTSSPGLQNRYSVADIKDNVIPHVAFLQSCVAAGVGRYVFLSSGGTVYGPSAIVPIVETADTTPISSHGLTKLMVEKYIQMHGQVDGLDFTILRLANPFGPGQTFRKAQGLIPAILSRRAEGLPIRIIGNGLSKRDYIFIDDVVDAIELAITARDASRVVMNVGSGEARSVIDVVNAVEAVLGTALEREFVPARNTDVDVNVLDISLAKRVLGWSPKVSFEEGLRRTLLSDAEGWFL